MYKRRITLLEQHNMELRQRLDDVMNEDGFVSMFGASPNMSGKTVVVELPVTQNFSNNEDEVEDVTELVEDLAEDVEQVKESLEHVSEIDTAVETTEQVTETTEQVYRTSDRNYKTSGGNYRHNRAYKTSIKKLQTLKNYKQRKKYLKKSYNL